MNYLTNRTLPRRTMLKGLGVALSLPLLDAMVPLNASAAPSQPKNLIAIEVVHGSAGSTNYGLSKNLWAPTTTGTEFDISKNILAPLHPYKEHLTIISNTDVRNAEAFTAPEIGGDHFRASAVFLTQSHPKQTQGSDVFVGTSLDQIYAKEYGQQTPLPSMQLCIENVDQAGGCSYGYTCTYTDTISWSSPSEPLPMIRDPRMAFESLFGEGINAEDRRQRIHERRSLLDYVTKEVSRIQRTLPKSDARRLDHMMTYVREIERRIQLVEQHNQSGEERALPNAPVGVPDDFEEHMKLMFDLQVAAFMMGTTHVFSFKTGRDASNRVYPNSGVSGGFHPTSHHGEVPSRIEDFAKINRYYVSLLPYLIEKLKAVPSANGTLLDDTLVIYGSPMGNPNLHNHKRCPLLLLGHAGGTIKGNRHIKAADGTPMANAMLGALHHMGLPTLASFGDSNCVMDLNA
jgi:hypothetical protein